MGRSILTGKLGEDLAAQYLEVNGYTLIARNYRYKKSEIDIIAMLNNTLIFIEVKFRKNNTFGNPEDFVTPTKEALILIAAENYIFENNWRGNLRFDIISLTTKDNLLHIEDAF